MQSELLANDKAPSTWKSSKNLTAYPQSLSSMKNSAMEQIFRAESSQESGSNGAFDRAHPPASLSDSPAVEYKSASENHRLPWAMAEMCRSGHVSAGFRLGKNLPATLNL